MKLGKKAPVVDPIVPHLSRCMLMQPAAPAVDWTAKVPAWDQLGNDQYGDCTSAAVYHMLQCFAYNTGFVFDPTEQEALALYSATSGFPKVDEGAVELDVLKHWCSVGVPTYKGTTKCGFSVLNCADLNDLKLSIQFLGGAYLGMAMPLTAQTATGNVWDVDDSDPTLSAPGSWGGHAVCALAYDADSFTVVSWGQLFKVTNAFMLKYCDEAYAVASQDWLADSGVSPPGLNWSALTSELSVVGTALDLPPTQS